jgi:hypothetical protein
VGVGVQRAGTTWWYASIAQHPGIQQGLHKEVHFFDRFWAEEVPTNLAEQYARYFPRIEGAITGEWTPRYMFDHWTPALLKAAAPRARILVLLRDPIDRYRSGLVHDTTAAQAFGELIQLTVASTAVARGLYHGQLVQLLRHFERSRLLILQYERCLLEPAEELTRTLEFVGLECSSAIAPLGNRINATPDSLPELTSMQRTELAEFYRDDLAKLLTDFGADIDASLWPTCARLSL